MDIELVPGKEHLGESLKRTMVTPQENNAKEKPIKNTRNRDNHLDVTNIIDNDLGSTTALTCE